MENKAREKLGRGVCIKQLSCFSCQKLFFKKYQQLFGQIDY